ncbi:MAG: glycoside hydrolase family 9 protein [Verrucomicrobiota bacterium]
MQTNRLVILRAMLVLVFGICQTLGAASLEILVNHLGYDSRGAKNVVVQCAETSEAGRFQVLDSQGRVAFDGVLRSLGAVAGWQGRFYQQGDFSALVQPGKYRIQVGNVRSESFTVGERVLPEACLSDMLYYFRIQRCSGIYDRTDRNLGFFGDAKRPRVDVHGGWYDASGDVSKYIGCLNEGNYMSAQESPMAVWNFLQSAELLRKHKSQPLRALIPMLTEEALYGADFVLRMQDPSGYFYTSVFDSCSKDPGQREICSFKGLSHPKNNQIQAGYREGGGISIAALARISTLKQSGDYTPERYLGAAELGFKHLQAHNLEYLPNHQENLLDDYCALLAATELFNATKNQVYQEAARSRATSLTKRLAKDEKYSGWWRAGDDTEWPFFHAVDAGLPVVALMRYLQFEDDAARKAAIGKGVAASLQFELAITKEVTNPFGYARQYIKDVDGKRGAFFMPHRNETGYWWLGENSRIASLAAAALLGCQLATPEVAVDLRTYASNQVNWILGLNPFDMCMLQGKGRNNPGDYEAGAPNPPGGICNGITSGVQDERDIAFQPAPFGRRADWSWRWKEQWIPHASWLILALAADATAP